MNVNFLSLTTDHAWGRCECEAITRILEVSYPIDAEIHVRACSEITQAPLRSAMDRLAAEIGRSIIAEREAESLIRRYSILSVHDALEDVRCVLEGGFNRRYYLKRDILRACNRSPIPKCLICGERGCDQHQSAKDFAEWVRTYESGSVYFMLHSPTKFLKVGFSCQPAKRLQTHRSSIPGELTTLGIVPGGRCMERAIHEELGEWLVPGYKEWFFYSAYVKKYIARIVGVYDTVQPTESLAVAGEPQ